MKSSFLAILAFIGGYAAKAQETQSISVNTLNQTNTSQKTVLLNDGFIKGKIVFKDEAYAEPPLNYNKLTGQLLFLTPKGDTLALSKPETTAYITIGEDTLRYFNFQFLIQETHYGNMPNLYVRSYMKLIGKEKKGPYGTYSTVLPMNSNTTYTNDDNHTGYISVDENMIYKPQAEYFLFDANEEEFYPASKKAFYKAFPKQEKKLREFLDGYRPDYSSKDDLLQVFKYIQKIKD